VVILKYLGMEKIINIWVKNKGMVLKFGDYFMLLDKWKWKNKVMNSVSPKENSTLKFVVHMWLFRDSYKDK
jgi:hypothetical protein